MRARLLAVSLAVAGGGVLAAEPEWVRREIASRLTQFLDVSGSGANDVVVVGTLGAIVRFDGREWRPQTSGTRKTLTAVWAASPSDVFVTGFDGIVLYDDGSGWRRQESGTSKTLVDVWAASPNDVFAVGRGGTILHYDGRAWSRQTSGTPRDLNAVWGTSGSNVYAAGSRDTVLRYDGRHWSPAFPPSRWRRDFGALGGTSPDDVYVAGAEQPAGELGAEGQRIGALLRFDGTSWREVPSGDQQIAQAIWAVRRGEVYLAGSRLNGSADVWVFDGDRIRSLRPKNGFTPQSIWVAPTGHLYAVGAPGRVLVREAPRP